MNLAGILWMVGAVVLFIGWVIQLGSNWGLRAANDILTRRLMESQKENEELKWKQLPKGNMDEKESKVF